MSKIFLCILLVSLLPTAISAQSTASALLRELLDLPAPPAVAVAEEAQKKKMRPSDFFDDRNAPAADAPLEDLTDYWKVKAANFNAGAAAWPTASAEVSLRLLESFTEAPARIAGYLNILSNDKEIAEKVKFLYDSRLQTEDTDENVRRSVKDWLKFKSVYYLDELRSDAEKVKDKGGYVDKSETLSALADLDWETAAPILEKLVADRKNPRAATLARIRFYERAVREKNQAEIERYRTQLKSIVTDREASPFSRDEALEALFAGDWEGRDEWYLSLLEDETLLFPTEGYRLFTPLTTPASKDPDKWIPILTRLVGNRDRAVHNAAVQSLMQLRHRKEAIEPLLPWLFDENWADIPYSSDGRTTLMQIVSDFDLPQSVPGLIWIVENEDGNAHWAARSLGKMKDGRAVPALKHALERIKEETYRETIVNALLDCGGLTDDEQMSALEFYAEYITEPENLERIENRNAYDTDDPLPVLLTVGRVLSRRADPAEGLIVRLVERQKILQKEKPPVAKTLSALMSQWQNRLFDLETLSRLAEGRADAELVIGALARRRDLKEKASNEIYALRAKNDASGALAACLTDDEAEIVSAFRAFEIEKQTAALACARLIRMTLPLDEVGRLLNAPDKLLALAAERYLESEDSPEARRLVWAKYPGEARVLGATDSFDPTRRDFSPAADSINRLFQSVNGASLFLSYYPTAVGEMEKTEKRLRREVLEDAQLLEVYYYQNNFIRVYKDKTVYSWQDDEARVREKILSAREFEDFRQVLIQNDIENLSSLRGPCHHDCGIGYFLRLNRNGGRRVTAYNAFGQIGGLFWFLGSMRTKPYKIRYSFENAVSNLKVLLADEPLKPQMIWKNGEDFRVLVADQTREEAIDEEILRLDKLDEADENLDYEEKGKRARQRRRDRAYEHYEWRSFKDGKPGAVVSEPGELPFLSTKTVFPEFEDLTSNESELFARAGGYEIRAGDGNTEGLWKVRGGERIKIADGRYAKPVTTPDGKWVAAAKFSSRRDEPHFVVRIDLRTGREYKIKLPEAKSFYPAAFVPEHGKILLHRGESDYSTLTPNAAEYYLLDAETGRTELVRGEFQPYLVRGFRPLQSSGRPHEYWTAIYSRARNETEIGVYNARGFSFARRLKLPGVLISSGEIWVDERQGKIYVIYTDRYGHEPHLLSFDLSD